MSESFDKKWHRYCDRIAIAQRHKDSDDRYEQLLGVALQLALAVDCEHSNHYNPTDCEFMEVYMKYGPKA